MLTVTTRTHVLKTLATQPPDNAYTKERLVMITMHVPKIAAMLIQENVPTLQSLALTPTHVLEILAILSRDASTLLNLTSNNCKLMTNVTPMFAMLLTDNWLRPQ